MNAENRVLLALVCSVSLVGGAFAEADGWKAAQLDNGSISVKYRISERIDENGDKAVLIEDFARAIVDGNKESFIALLRDIPRHKDFSGDYTSDLISAVSGNEWLIYYFTKNPWPVPDTDRVSTMSYSEETESNTAVFTLSAEPTMLEAKGVKRATYFNITYSFKDLGNGKVEITETGKSSPPVKVPLWLIKSAFPGAPADSLRKLIKLAKEY